jgi:hypothetical protein
MKRSTLRTLSLLPFIWLCCQSSAWPQIVDTPKGRVEFVGLRNWDIATIEQRLQYDSPEKLFSNVLHDLTKRLGFAGAHCAVYRQDGRPYKVITVLEPEDAMRVRYLPEPVRQLPTPAAWVELLKIVEERKFLNTMLDYGSTLKDAITTETLMSEADEQWFVLLQERRSEEDFTLALDRLAGDADDKNRVIGAMVLANFGERDSTWRALVGGLRDANEGVRTVCAQTLLSLVNYAPRKIDWSDSTVDFNLLLGGTNLTAYQWVIEILLKTEVSPKLAGPLLQGDARELLLAYLRASHDHERKIAHDLLARLGEQDFGYDGKRWEEWLGGFVAQGEEPTK